MSDVSVQWMLVRMLARGDVLLCSAIAHEIVKRDPRAKVLFQTQYPELFARNPDVAEAGPDVKFSNCPGSTGNRFCNLNLVIVERFSNTHLIDGFAMGAGFPAGTCGHHTVFVLPRLIECEQIAAQLDLPLNKKYVILAPGPGQWPGRNWSERNWVLLNQHIQSLGYATVLVGTSQFGAYPSLKPDLDLRDKTSVDNLAVALSQASLFIGIDSFPAHLAANLCPRIVLFGVTKPEFILSDAANTESVCSDPKHPLTGLRHRVNTMRDISLSSPRDNPMETIKVEVVIDTCRKFI